ncbi:hypothetical protein MKZ38_004568 [Zalerion maritima]|uniref:Thioesterase family protein n=1 Tax=Zalerion maritima TaxID=339359 RepID=A0AAD5RWH8_9PEZI|nr:hypothetical protein MKZ38_004568 [Zalerion maritima]
MAPAQDSKELLPFAAATQIRQLESHVYAGDFSSEFCIGSVPNGGYVATHFLKVARLHLSPRRQHNALTAHWEFLSRSSAGPAVFVVEDVKLGRQTSVLHIKLFQGGSSSSSALATPAAARGRGQPVAAAYVTQSNFASEEGLSLPTGHELHPPVPKVDLEKLGREEEEEEEGGQGGGVEGDENWTRVVLPDSAFKMIRNFKNCMYYAPRRGHPRRSIVDLWLRLPGGERFTQDSLGYVVDAWPTIVESYRPPAPAPGGGGTGGGGEDTPAPFPYDEVFWYPTVVMNLEVKKALPEEGEEWLFMRVLTRQIKNGRLDLEVLVYDRMDELVAVSSHVNLVLGVARNVAGRGKSSL